MVPHNYNFPAKERLKKRDSFKVLMDNGVSAKAFPIKIIWHCIDYDGESNLKVSFNVTKKKFKSAVSRIRIKRQLREAYRLNRMDLYDQFSKKDKTCLILIQYISPDFLPYDHIQTAIQATLNKIKCG